MVIWRISPSEPGRVLDTEAAGALPSLQRHCSGVKWLARCCLYKGRSINKLQNGAIPSIIRIGKIRNVLFVQNLILNIRRHFFDDDVIIVTSSIHRTQSICVLLSPPVYYNKSRVINSIGMRKNE